MSKNQDQIARRRATQDVIAQNRAYFEERMHHYYEEMGLGEWKPRLSAEERAEAKAAAEKAANVAKIKALAEKAGIGVLLVDDPKIEEKMQSAQDGTFQGVEHPDYPWDKTEPPAEDEGVPEDDGPDEFDRRDESLSTQADAAFTDNIAVVKSVIGQG